MKQTLQRKVDSINYNSVAGPDLGPNVRQNVTFFFLLCMTNHYQYLVWLTKKMGLLHQWAVQCFGQTNTVQKATAQTCGNQRQSSLLASSSFPFNTLQTPGIEAISQYQAERRSNTVRVASQGGPTDQTGALANVR